MNFSGSAAPPTVFSIRKDGTGYTELFSGFKDFSGNLGDISYFSGLIQGSDGAFYSTGRWGGPQGAGTVFKLWPADVPAFSISAARPDGSVTLRFLSSPPTNCVLLSTTTLARPVNWKPIAAGTTTDGIWQFTVTNAPNDPERFYQVVTGWTP
jgi:hypothetical protein